MTAYRFTRATTRLNALFMTVTIAAMVAAMLTSGLAGLVLAWVFGHLAWGGVLAARVLRGNDLYV
jgi:hypothetical protein